MVRCNAIMAVYLAFFCAAACALQEAAAQRTHRGITFTIKEDRSASPALRWTAAYAFENDTTIFALEIWSTQTVCCVPGSQLAGAFLRRDLSDNSLILFGLAEALDVHLGEVGSGGVERSDRILFRVTLDSGGRGTPRDEKVLQGEAFIPDEKATFRIVLDRRHGRGTISTIDDENARRLFVVLLRLLL